MLSDGWNSVLEGITAFPSNFRNILTEGRGVELKQTVHLFGLSGDVFRHNVI